MCYVSTNDALESTYTAVHELQTVYAGMGHKARSPPADTCVKDGSGAAMFTIYCVLQREAEAWVTHTFVDEFIGGWSFRTHHSTRSPGSRGFFYTEYGGQGCNTSSSTLSFRPCTCAAGLSCSFTETPWGKCVHRHVLGKCGHRHSISSNR